LNYGVLAAMAVETVVAVGVITIKVLAVEHTIQKWYQLHQVVHTEYVQAEYTDV
jgi:hypothetical protein|tara:strand:+ start:931 stop:1092 length:162 start_codon:yes stop_codon:yes gene_type:complete